MKILAIDPSCKGSSFVIWNGKEILKKSKSTNPSWQPIMIKDSNYKVDNYWLNEYISECKDYIDLIVIEDFECYGMPIGITSIETIKWIGRFEWQGIKTDIKVKIIKRSDIKLYFCHTKRAKDSNIRRALIDRFGEPGTKKDRGLTYGLAGDLWQVLALAVYAYDKRIC